MSPIQWKSLLTVWSAQVLTTDLTRHLAPADRKLKYLGFPSASAADIKSVESRLGVALPPSYRSFLKATNGFRVISPFTYRLRPTDEVDWFRVEHQGWIETYNEPTPYDAPDIPEPSDEEYFDYSELNPYFREHHLGAMLQISDDGDGVMLLNPLVVTPDGEWEAWFFANWIPGAHRYASFAHMMIETYRSMRKVEKLPNTPKLTKIKIPSPKLPRHSVVAPYEPHKPKFPKLKRKKGQSQLEYVAEFLAAADKEDTTPASTELVELLKSLNNPDAKSLAKTIRILNGKQKIRGASTRHPDLVPLASEIALEHTDPAVRMACVSLLTNITPDGPVPKWLLTALEDTHPWVLTAALYAVYYFKGPELVAPIITVLSNARDLQLVNQAIHALSEIPDSRAIPELAAQLERDCPIDDAAPPIARQQLSRQHYGSIAVSLAKYGQQIVPLLTKFLQHADPARRVAAIVGLRALGEPSSRAAVEKVKSDPDPEVRQQAETCDRIWGNLPGFKQHNIL